MLTLLAKISSIYVNIAIFANKKQYKMNKLRNNDQRARTAITLIWIVTAIDLIALASSYFQYNMLESISAGGQITMEEANANDSREQFIGIFYIIAYIISGITFIMWFRRAYFNLHQRVTKLNFSEGWAAGSWFVPFVNLGRPARIMQELYTETTKFLNKFSQNKRQFNFSNYIGWWWALWLISGIFGQIIFRYSRNADSINDFTNITILSMISSLLAIPLALLTVNVIKNYNNMEQSLIKIDPEDESQFTDAGTKTNEGTDIEQKTEE